eukprot:jgi/Chrzof1/4014/Cz13g17080.t1
MHDARSAIQIDYVTQCLELSRKLQLGPGRTAALLNVADKLLKACADGSVLEDCWKLLRNSLLDACSAAPEGNDTALSPDQIAAIAGLFTANLFQHFSLYSYVFTHEQQHTQYQANLMVETAVPVPPLELAMISDDWERHLADEAARLEAERQAAEAAKQAQEEAAAKEAADRQKAQEQAEHEAKISKRPKTLEEAVEQLVAVCLEEERKQLDAMYAAKEQTLLTRMAQLEAHAAAPPGKPSSASGRK